MAIMAGDKSMHSIGNMTLAQAALDAAIELDKFVKSGHANPEPIRGFTSLLSTTSGLDQLGGPSGLIGDPLAATAFGRVIQDIAHRPIGTIGDLAGQLDSYVGKLSALSDRAPDVADVSLIRDFCVAVYNALASQETVWSEDERELSTLHELAVSGRRVC